MRAILLIDFGSTYTKVTAVDADTPRLIGTASSYTTVEEDVGVGLDRAVQTLTQRVGKISFVEQYACSSAAGGLRMVACGLVPSLTTEAAKRAALGAGAKVIRTYAYQLTPEDLAEIRVLKPDIFLLCGGIDGGNTAYIEENARLLATLAPEFTVILAGNRASRAKCMEYLDRDGREVVACENVMPQFNQLQIAPCQKIIRDVFLRRIVAAKGLSRTQALIKGILMPTPAAVMSALTVLAEEVGECMAIDLGGATTDVYSIAKGLPTHAGAVLTGLPEPFAKRSVEGDIGMRYSARGILDAAGIEELARIAGQPEQAVEDWFCTIDRDKSVLAQTPAEEAMDFALASKAIEIGLIRHAGTLTQVFTPMGMAYQQVGKDLTGIEKLFLTGGELIHRENAADMALRAMTSMIEPNSLMPRKAQIVVDRQYILYAIGLLTQNHPRLALDLMKKEFS